MRKYIDFGIFLCYNDIVVKTNRDVAQFGSSHWTHSILFLFCLSFSFNLINEYIGN